MKDISSLQARACDIGTGRLIMPISLMIEPWEIRTGSLSAFNSKHRGNYQLFEPRYNPLIGLDIGSSSIKAVQLKTDSEKPSLEHIAVAEIEAAGDDPDATAEAISAAIAQMGSKVKDVAASVAGPAVAVRGLEFPKLSPDELKGAVWWEGGQVIPFDIEDVFTDFRVLSESDKTDVLFVATSKRVIDERISLIRKCRLEPRIIDVDSLAILNCFLREDNIEDYGTVAILSIGARLTNLSIIGSKLVPFTRDILIAGNNFTEAIEGTMDVSFGEAERLKKEEIHSITPKAVDLMETRMRELISEIKDSFNYYQKKEPESQLTKILLTGGSSRLSYLGRLISDELKLPVETWNPLQSIEIDHQSFDTEFIEQIGPFTAVALGLALRRNP